MMAPLARASNVVLHPASGVLVKGVFLHPDHFASLEPLQQSAGVEFADPFPSVEDALKRVSDISLSSPSSPASSHFPESPMDYFSTRHHSDAASYSTAASSPASSDCSTPTTEQPYPKAPSLSRNSSFQFYSTVEPASSDFPATFSFSTFAAPESNPPSRPASPPRAHPYARRAVGGSSMQRSVSSPVETQRQLDHRRRAMSLASAALSEQVGKMSRSKSVVGLPGMATQQSVSGLGFTSVTPVAPSQTRSTPFGEGWGAALPPREEPEPQMIPFPYNVALQSSPRASSRLSRSCSVSTIDNKPMHSAAGLQRHRGSLPVTPVLSAPGSPSLSPSIAMTSSRRRSMLVPLTPIIPSSSLMAVEETPSTAAFAAAVEATHNTSPKPGRLVRGVTF